MWSPDDELRRQLQSPPQQRPRSSVPVTPARLGTTPAASNSIEQGGLHMVTPHAATGAEEVRSAAAGSTYVRQQAALGGGEPGGDAAAATPASARKSSGGQQAVRYWEPLVCQKCRVEGHDSGRCPLNLPVCDICGSLDHADAACPGRRLLARAAPAVSGQGLRVRPLDCRAARGAAAAAAAAAGADEFGESAAGYDCGPTGWTQREDEHFCCNCGAAGHGADGCTQAAVDATMGTVAAAQLLAGHNSSTSWFATSQSGDCYKCGQPGHFARDGVCGNTTVSTSKQYP